MRLAVGKFLLAWAGALCINLSLYYGAGFTLGWWGALFWFGVGLVAVWWENL